MTNVIKKKPQKMTLKGYYDSLPNASYPKTDFVTKVQMLCGVSMTTARNWIEGKTRPCKLENIEKLSELTGIDKEQLWMK